MQIIVSNYPLKKIMSALNSNEVSTIAPASHKYNIKTDIKKNSNYYELLFKCMVAKNRLINLQWKPSSYY